MRTQVEEVRRPGRSRTSPGTVLPAQRYRGLLALQAKAGNAAVAGLLGGHERTGHRGGVTVQRCGEAPGSCGCCGSDDKAERDAAPAVQRQAVGPQASVQRRVDGDVRLMSISPDWSRALTDGELASQLMLLRQHIAGLPANDSQREGAGTNLRMLEAETERRTAAQTLGGLRLGQHTGRPPGLPDGGFALVELPDVPVEALEQLPVGELTTISAAALYRTPQAGAGSALPPGAVRGTEVAGAAAGGGVLASGVNMARWGFPGGAQGQYSVGIVVRPRANPIDWGHTSLTLRRGPAPLEVIGFKPDMRTAQGLLDLARNYRGIEAGSRAVGGRFTGDAAMFAVEEAIHIEYPIGEAQAAKFAMARPGRAPALDYVARPGVYRPAAGACSGANCGLWAIGEIEAQTGGVVGRAADPVGITSMSKTGPVSPPGAPQPGIVDMARGGVENPASIRPLTPGGPTPVVSSMPRVVRVLRVGGKVMLVVGVVAGAYEVVAARPEERSRTAVGVGGGFVGGLALGATAGLICGPGAPVCSLVFGLGLGVLGALGGRAAAEAVYDEVNAPPTTSSGPTGSTSGPGPAPPTAQEQWELMFTPPPPPTLILFQEASTQSPLVRPATSVDLAFAGLPTSG